MADSADPDQAYDIIGRDMVPAPTPQPHETLQQRIANVEKWLQPTDFLSPGNEFKKHLNSYAPGTGRWVHESPVFRAWVAADSSHSRCLHVRGVAGSGKSVFSAYTICRLQESGGVVLFFFFRQIVDKNHTAKYLVRDFAAQLLPHCPALVTALTALSQEHAVGGNEMDLVWPALVKALADDGIGGQRVYCVVDALDEMDDEDFEDMTQKLVSLGTMGMNPLKVLMTSRPLPKIETALRHQSVAQLKLDLVLLSPDVARYVDARMATLDPPLSDDKNDLVKQTICDRASGLFLHARLMTDNLAEALRQGRVTPETLPDSLDRLPRSLREVYEHMLLEHAQRSGVMAEQQAKILMCVTHASRPLRLIELASLLSRMLNIDLRKAKSLVRAGCGRLLEILEDETVSVIHHSFTEFLHDASRKDNEAAFPVLDDATSHATLAVLSLEYLDSCPHVDVTIDDTRDINYEDYSIRNKETDRRNAIRADLRLGHPLASYAIENLIFHIRLAAPGPVERVMAALDQFFSAGKPAYENWVLMRPTDRLSAASNVLHLALTMSSDQTLPIYVLEHYSKTKASHIDARDHEGRTPLSYAASYGHDVVAAFLLSKGADPTSVGDDGLTPLHRAAKRSHPKVVRLLLDTGIDPLIRTGPVFRAYDSYEGYWEEYSEETAESRRKTALDHAFEGDNSEVIKAFMPFIPPEEVNLRFHQTNNVEIVEAILATGMADIESYSGGNTKLGQAAQAGNVKMVELLLRHGADPSRRCEPDSYLSFGAKNGETGLERGPTPLHMLTRSTGWSSRSKGDRHRVETCVRMLTDAGADINATMQGGYYGRDMTPLHCAVQQAECSFNLFGITCNSEELLTDALLSAGADPNARNQAGNTPAHVANSEKPPVLESLVRNGADIDARNALGRTPLLEMINHLRHGTSSFNQPKPSAQVFTRLLELGTDLNTTDNDGRTIIHYIMHSIASLSHPEYMPWIRKLLQAGPDLNHRDNMGRPSLWRYKQCDRHTSTPNESDEMVLRELVEAGMDLNARNETGQTGLWAILERFDEGLPMIQKFVRLGANPILRANDGTTLLHAAVSHRRPAEWLRYLLSVGIDANMPGPDGDTLIHTVLRNTVEDTRYAQEVIPILLEAGVSATAKNDKGQSALHVVRTLENLEAVLDNPVFHTLDVDDPDIDGLTPLHVAAGLGETAVGRLIRAGADPMVVTASGLSPLHIAARSDQANVMHLLLAVYRERGVLEKQVNQLGEGRAPLHYACISGRPESVWQLLDNGADPQLRDNHGLTPLHALAEFQPPAQKYVSHLVRHRVNTVPPRTADIVSMLAEAGADLEAEATVPNEGDQAKVNKYTPRDLASQNGCWEMVRELMARSIRPPTVLEKSEEFVLATDKEKAADFARATTRPQVRGSSIRGRGGARGRSHRWRGRWAATGTVKMSPEEVKETYFIDGGQMILDLQAEDNQGKGKEEDSDKEAGEEDDDNDQDGSDDKDRTAHAFDAAKAALQDGDYDSIKEFAKLGGDGLVMDWNFFDTLLHYLIAEGFTNLLEDFANDIPRLEAQQERGKSGSGTLLAAACSRVLPSLHIIRLLVERFEVKHKPSYLSDHMPEVTAVHILASGAFYWHVEALDYLLSKGFDIEARGWNGLTPLMTACVKDHTSGFWWADTARVLLKHGADPNAIVGAEEMMAGQSALEISSRPEATRLLLESGASLAKCPGLLAKAARKWMEPEQIRLLLEAGLDPNYLAPQDPQKDERSSSDQRHGNLEGESTEPGTDMPRYALHEAARPTTEYNVAPDFHSRQQATVELLLSRGSDPCAPYPDGSFVLQCIVEDGSCMNALIPHFRNLNLNLRGRHSRTLLISACVPTNPVGPRVYLRSGEEPPCPAIIPAVIEALLENGADVLAVDEEGRTALHWLCTLPGKFDDDQCKAFAALVSHGPGAINMRDSEGRKPLHVALATFKSRSQTSTFAIRRLLTAGADPEPDPVSGDSILHSVAPQIIGESEEVAEATALFREMTCSLDINGRNAAGETPVMTLASARWTRPHYRPNAESCLTHANALDVFVELGADLAAVDARGWTLLHLLAERDGEGVEGAFKRLLELGVDPRREDHELRTAIDVAVAKGMRSIVMLFSEGGREIGEGSHESSTEESEDSE